MKTIFGIFDSYPAAKSAVDTLLGQDFTSDELNALVQEEIAKEQSAVNFEVADVQATDEVGEKTLHGLDYLIAGEQPVDIPDVGEVLAAGELGTMLAKAAAVPGEVDGGLRKALADFSVAEEYASKYRARVEAGELLVFIRAPDDRAQEAAQILEDAGGRELSSVP